MKSYTNSSAIHVVPRTVSRFQVHRAARRLSFRSGIQTNSADDLTCPSSSQPQSASRIQLVNAQHHARHPSDPTAHAVSLCRVLGMQQPRFMTLVARCPELFSFSPEALDATVLAVAGLTGLQTYQVPQLVAVDPELLLQPDRLKRNIQEIAEALGVATSEVRSMASREPAVLAISGPKVEARLAALMQMLLLVGSYGGLVQAVLQNPGVLLVPEPEIIRGQLEALEVELLRLKGLSSTEVMKCSTAADPAHGQAPAHPLRALLAPLLLAKPTLLTTPPELVAGRTAHLATKAQVPPERVLQAAASGPNLLAASSCHIDRHCIALANALPEIRSADRAATALVAAPALLAQNVTALASKWHVLTSVLRSNVRWSGCLAGATEGEVAELLVLPYITIARLRFLADHGLQDNVMPLQAVRASDASFHASYPSFREWLRG